MRTLVVFSGIWKRRPPGFQPGTCSVSLTNPCLRTGLCYNNQVKSNTLFFLTSGIILATLHYLALEFFLYWRYLWLDMPVHFLGGATVIFAWQTLRELRVPLPAHFFSFWSSLIVVFIVAIAWELFEFQIGAPIGEDIVLDTSLDLSLGILGGLVAYFVGKSASYE